MPASAVQQIEGRCHYRSESREAEIVTNIQKRLEKGVALLEQLEQQRLETRTPRLGYDAEFEIITRELCELEEDILRDPGALGSQLVRVRRKRR